MTLDVLANGMLGMWYSYSSRIISKTDLDFFLVSCSVITFELKPTLPYLICGIYNMLCQCTWLNKQCLIMLFI